VREPFRWRAVADGFAAAVAGVAAAIRAPPRPCGQKVTIAWTDSDPDDNAFVSLARDTDTTATPWANQANHTWLVLNLSEDADGTGDQYQWDTTNVAPGTYSVWGMIYDGTNPQVYDRAPGLVTVVAINQSPTIGALLDAPDPVALDETLTLTATGVTDSDGSIARVEFYRDSNNNNLFEVGTDVFLGTGTRSGNNWTWSGPVTGFSTGINLYFARACDDEAAWSCVVSTTGVVKRTLTTWLVRGATRPGSSQNLTGPGSTTACCPR
jgi:hypothetical protein